MTTRLSRPSKALLERHHAFVASDNTFQRRARLLQTLWREREGLAIGSHRGRPLGSRIAMPAAEERLENYLTPTIRDVVRREVIEAPPGHGALFGRPRIFNDLLSSQPLCFNLFGELSEDLELATRVFRRLLPGRVHQVEEVAFERSPGRGDRRYTGDKSAFDVFVRFRDASGGTGFVGIEVKYHEDLSDQPANHRERYDELAEGMGVFKRDHLKQLRAKPLQQIWRDHLLAGSMLGAGDGWADGCFAFLYPRDNMHCARAVAAYRECLTDQRTFVEWTLEGVVAAIVHAGDSEWVQRCRERYLGFARVDYAVAQSEG